VFSFDGKSDLGVMNHCEFEVGIDPSVTQCWSAKRRLPQTHEAEFTKVVTELAAYGIAVVAPDDTGFASPIVMVPKRDHTGTITLLRMCVDYRRVNSHTPPDRYPLPLPEDLFNRTAGWNLYSSGDLKSGFNQVRMKASDQPYTSFHGPTCLLMYTRMPFGLKRAPNFFQRQMELIVQDAGIVFIDDLLTGDDIAPDYSNFEVHLASIDKLLSRLAKFGVTLDPRKCHWAKRRIKFLGHFLSGGTIGMEQSKVAAILAIARPAVAGYRPPLLGAHRRLLQPSYRPLQLHCRAPSSTPQRQHAFCLG
jgi:hypothetical protein